MAEAPAQILNGLQTRGERVGIPLIDRMKMYTKGEVHFADPRVSSDISFAYVTDLHLPPYNQQKWPDRYRKAIAWWDKEFEQPHKSLPTILDEAKALDVDFVFFGGDNLDYYDPQTADLLVTLCKERDLQSYFSLGNHDFESPNIRYAHHDYDEDLRATNAKRLFAHWAMPGRYYAFESGTIRFVVLDTPYRAIEGGFAGFYDSKQVDWLIDQLSFDGPIVVFHHIPFVVDANRFRLGLTWNGVKGSVADNDPQTKKVLKALAENPNILGTFAGHTHVRSEDPIGKTCQFVTAAANQSQWRYVRISSNNPPKSLRAPGQPTVEDDSIVPPTACDALQGTD